VIEFRAEDLSALPGRRFYELWFVAADEVPGKPDRISAGTFRPSSRGSVDVSFQTAADPPRYPVLSVTAEPDDGNPVGTGPEVLRSTP
jgi:anti-sigma-K factor RskA